MNLIHMMLACWIVLSLVGATFLYWHNSTEQLTQW